MPFTTSPCRFHRMSHTRTTMLATESSSKRPKILLIISSHEPFWHPALLPFLLGKSPIIRGQSTLAVNLRTGPFPSEP